MTRSPSPRPVSFTGHGGIRLAGVLHPPSRKALGSVVLSHCFTCSKDYKILAWLARVLAERGFSVLRFDFAGLGHSEGDFRFTTLSSDIEDLLCACSWLEEEGKTVVALVGLSMGGAASILAASALPTVRSVAVLGTSGHVGRRIAELLAPGDRKILEDIGEVAVSVGDRLYPVTREFMQDLSRHSVLERVRIWDKALLAIHGVEDRIVSCEEGEELFRAAPQPKAFLAVPGGNHLFTAEREHGRLVGRVIADWIQLNRRSE